MEFRKAKPEDLPRLEALEQAVVDAERPFNSEIKPQGARYYDLPELISSPDCYLLVAEAQGDIMSKSESRKLL